MLENRKGAKTVLKRFLPLIGLLIILFLLTPLIAISPVEFADENLEMAIKDALDIPYRRTLYTTQLQGLSFLDASARGVARLEGIENLTQLETLILDHNFVEDVSPLRSLPRLETLSLVNNSIIDLDAVNMSSLAGGAVRSLNLCRNTVASNTGGREGISDIGALAGLTSLQQLNLRYNRVDNISSLGNLSGMRTLDLRGNRVSDISPLSNMKGLRDLDLRDNSISDISVLSGLSRLRKLNLRGNDIEDISALARLYELEYLNLHSNADIRSVMPLASLTRLRTLILGNVPVDDEVGALRKMTNLVRLNLRNAGVRDVSVIGGLMAAGALQDKLPQFNKGLPERSAIFELAAGDVAHFDQPRWIRAEVNIDGNPLPMPVVGEDHFNSLRPYWANVGIRRPYSLPPVRLPPPEFSHPAGFYTDGFMLEINCPDDGADVYYTLDGSIPHPVDNSDHTFKYTGALAVESREGEPNDISMIHPGYLDREWHGPTNEVFKVTVIRAAAIDLDTGVSSDVITNTYIVDSDIHNRYRLPVVSLVTDPDNFFSHERGIHVAGKLYEDTVGFGRDMNPDKVHHHQPANFHQRGRVRINAGGLKVAPFDDNSVFLVIPDHGFNLDFSYRRDLPQVTIRGTRNYDGIYYLLPESTKNRLVFKSEYVPERFPAGAEIFSDWERPINIELFEPGGELGFSQQLGVRIHGGASRIGQQKTFRFYARSDYGQEDILDYQLFPDDSQSLFKRFLLRRSTERSGVNDILGQLFMERAHPGMDIQRYRPAVVFLNGEFWGIYFFRDRYDHWYIALKYDIERSDVAFVEGRSRPELKYGNSDDLVDFVALIQFMEENDLSCNENYNYVKKRLDVDGYAAWIITGIFVDYQDWGCKHFQYWRYNAVDDKAISHPHLDGRWRVMPLDLDKAFDLPSREVENYAYNYLEEIAESRNYFLKHLQDNEDFKHEFINRFADIMNTVLREDVAVKFAKDLVEEIPESVWELNVSRWRHQDSLESWQSHYNDIIDFLRRRPAHMRQHIIEYFELSGTAKVTLRTDPEKGHIRINTIDITTETFGIEDAQNWTGVYFRDVPVKIVASPKPGYRFAGWQGSDQTDAEIDLKLSEDVVLTAIFEPAD